MAFGHKSNGFKIDLLRRELKTYVLLSSGSDNIISKPYDNEEANSNTNIFGRGKIFEKWLQKSLFLLTSKIWTYFAIR